LEDFFTQDPDDVESHFRVASQKIKQPLAGNEIEAAITLGFGSEAVRLSRESGRKADNVARPD
jgi:hypothetical protein